MCGALPSSTSAVGHRQHVGREEAKASLTLLGESVGLEQMVYVKVSGIMDRGTCAAERDRVEKNAPQRSGGPVRTRGLI